MIRLVLLGSCNSISTLVNEFEKRLVRNDKHICYRVAYSEGGYQRWEYNSDCFTVDIIGNTLIIYGSRYVINYEFHLGEIFKDAQVIFYDTVQQNELPSELYEWYDTQESALPKTLSRICNWAEVEDFSRDILTLGRLVEALKCFEHIGLHEVSFFPWGEDAGFLKHAYHNYIGVFKCEDDKVEAFIRTKNPPYADILCAVKRIANYKED